MYIEYAIMNMFCDWRSCFDYIGSYAKGGILGLCTGVRFRMALATMSFVVLVLEIACSSTGALIHKKKEKEKEKEKRHACRMGTAIDTVFMNLAITNDAGHILVAATQIVLSRACMAARLTLPTMHNA
jgi:hypothetical protein